MVEQKLTLGCYLWHEKDPPLFTVDDVLLLQRMVDRHMTIPHDWVCFTDRPEAFENTDIRPLPLDEDTHIKGRMFDKIGLFRPDAKERLGGCDRFCIMDIDVVVTANIDHIFKRTEDLVLWRNPARYPWKAPELRHAARALYNISIMLFTPGTHTYIWNDYHPARVIPFYRADQDYIAAKVGMNVPYWNGMDGIYRLGREGEPQSGPRAELPDNACMVFFPGDMGKPTIPAIQEECKWIGEHRC